MNLVIPDEFKKISRDKPFLLHDSGPERDRILIFSTIKNLEMLKKSNEWFVDGTFKTAPHPFYQVFTIHGICFKKGLKMGE
jgi:hypothetical protein